MKKNILALALVTASLFGAPSFERVEDKNPLKILTPALADRKTAKIRLSNGLEAYLISDPEAHESAAALAVKAGSWQDPKEYPGMAHFLEHMLFMGTAAYPKEKEYMQYIGDHGGQKNAYTASDRTVYSFAIKNNGFIGALDRFSHFFVDPLFSPSCIRDEFKAVDQEHAKNIENDAWRAWMILKETGNPDHPNAGFSTGNAATLSGIPQEAMKKWYREHYSANQMHLIAISTLPMEEMIQLVVEKFSQVPNHHLETAAYPHELFSPQQQGHFIYIKPVKDLKMISLSWQLPQELALENETSVPALISYVLSNGTENGLLEELKREKIAENIAASADRLSKDSLIFSIDISLTEAGIKQIDTVMTRVFQTLNRMKETGIPRYIFDENQRMAKIGYEYQSRTDVFSYVTEAVAAMLLEKLETFPLKSCIPQRYDANLIHTMLESLRPETCVYLVCADPKHTGVAPTLQEKWMSASYAIKEISASQFLSWSQAKPHPLIDIPSPNPYLPESLALIPSAENPPATPTLMTNDELGKIYFQQDHKYQVPETGIIFSLKTPQMDGTAKSRALFDLYIRALGEKLSSPLFFAEKAGISFNTIQKDFDFEITVSGYSEKVPLFVKTVFQSLQDVSPTSAEFEIYKQSLLSSYDNASKELPVRQSAQLLYSLIYNNYPTPRAKLQALKGISYEEFLSFAHELFKAAYAQGMVYGNLTSAEASNIWGEFKTGLNPAPFVLAKHYKKGVLSPSEKQGPYMIVQNTERQGNSVVLMLHEGPFTMEKRAAQQILSNALKEDFFSTLRTKQQTGYIATSWDIEVERQLLQFFAVQSITHEPPELLARFELFLEGFSHHMDKKISPERFANLKASLIKELEMPPQTLPQKAAELNLLSFEYNADYEWKAKRIDAVKNLTLDNFVTLSSSFLGRSNLKRLAVLMEGIIPEQNQFRYEVIAQDDIRGIGPYISAK